MPDKALSSVRVLEYCHLVAGPYCSKLLADLGAEVVKIEQPGVADPARRRGPFLNDMPHPERSGLFLYLNTNKLGVTLNLADQRGKNIFLKLVEAVDILIEDQHPGFWSGLGLGYEQLRQINTRLVMTSITPFGQTGPYRDFKCYPLNLFHAGGEGYLTPGWGGYEPDRPPLRAGRYVGDYESGLSAAVAALGAFYWQQATGQGQHVDVSQQQSLMALNPGEIRYYPNLGAVASRATRTLSFGGILPCKDGYVELSIYEEHQWQALLKLMGEPEWAKQDKFKDRLSRSQNNAELNLLLAEWMKQHTKEELYHSGQALGVPIAPYNNTREVVASSQLSHRAFFVEIEHPETAKTRYPSAPYKFSRTPWRAERPAPLLGQHNEEIYGQRLGFSRQEIARLRQAGVI
jgi:crotonobetainyl-CoA:carnitine CoA-transferase CaiB-like acyl-CoA transferase